MQAQNWPVPTPARRRGCIQVEMIASRFALSGSPRCSRVRPTSCGISSAGACPTMSPPTRSARALPSKACNTRTRADASPSGARDSARSGYHRLNRLALTSRPVRPSGLTPAIDRGRRGRPPWALRGHQWHRTTSGIVGTDRFGARPGSRPRWTIDRAACKTLEAVFFFVGEQSPRLQ
jgi:hypothetical protein